MESRWDSELPRLYLDPHQTLVAAHVLFKPGFQRGQQLVALFGGQLIFGAGVFFIGSIGLIKLLSRPVCDVISASIQNLDVAIED